MISTKPKETKDKVTEILDLYKELTQEERSKFLEKATNWLIAKIEKDRLSANNK